MHDRFHVGGRCWETGLELDISMLYVTNIHVKIKSFIVKDVYVLSTISMQRVIRLRCKYSCSNTQI